MEWRQVVEGGLGDGKRQLLTSGHDNFNRWGEAMGLRGRVRQWGGGKWWKAGWVMGSANC